MSNKSFFRMFVNFHDVWRSNVHDVRMVLPQTMVVCLNIFCQVLCVVLTSNLCERFLKCLRDNLGGNVWLKLLEDR